MKVCDDLTAHLTFFFLNGFNFFQPIFVSGSTYANLSFLVFNIKPNFICDIIYLLLKWFPSYKMNATSLPPQITFRTIFWFFLGMLWLLHALPLWLRLWREYHLINFVPWLFLWREVFFIVTDPFQFFCQIIALCENQATVQTSRTVVHARSITLILWLSHFMPSILPLLTPISDHWNTIINLHMVWLDTAIISKACLRNFDGRYISRGSSLWFYSDIYWVNFHINHYIQQFIIKLTVLMLIRACTFFEITSILFVLLLYPSGCKFLHYIGQEFLILLDFRTKRKSVC